MPWQLVNPKYYGDSLTGRPTAAAPKATERGFGLHDGEVHGHARALWYQDTSSREQGELVLHVDQVGSLDWFQLTHTRWPHGSEHVAEWRTDGELHFGAVNGDGASESAARYRAASPTITRYAEVPTAILLEMTDYFLKHAETLEEAHREQIAGVLWHAMRSEPGDA